MATANPQIDRIFGSLESAGFPRTLQRSLLPAWVTNDVLADKAASAEIAAILAKRLGLRASHLSAADPHVEVLRRHETKYKRSIPNRSKNILAATSIAVVVAESVAAACRQGYSRFESNPEALRNEVLGPPFGGRWLGLRNLLMRCWAGGVAVIYLAELGPGIAKMDGMVVQTDSRPVIVLSKASQLWAWQLFILAHEIGHIALGHVAPDEILIDEELGAASYALTDADADEQAADRFAIELLNGRPEATYATSAPRVNGSELAAAAYEFGVDNQVDPGHIALNYAHTNNKWEVGQAAARKLQGSNPPAAVVINEAMWHSIDAEALPPDTVEFLRKVTDSAVA